MGPYHVKRALEALEAPAGVDEDASVHENYLVYTGGAGVAIEHCNWSPFIRSRINVGASRCCVFLKPSKMIDALSV